MDSWAESETRKHKMRKVLAKLIDLEASLSDILACHLIEVRRERIIIILLTLNLLANIFATGLLLYTLRGASKFQRSDASLLGMQLEYSENTSADILQVSGKVGVFAVGSSGEPAAETSFSPLFSTVSALPEGLVGRLASNFQVGAATVTGSVLSLRVVELDDPHPRGLGSKGHTFRHMRKGRIAYLCFSTPRIKVDSQIKLISSRCVCRGTESKYLFSSRSLTPNPGRRGEGSHLDLMTTREINRTWVLVARSSRVRGAKLTDDGFLGRIRNPKTQDEKSSC
jgi:hypothetical protein